MPITNYPFCQAGSSSYPLLPICITNPETGLSHRTWGLIDTGADECSIPADVAVLLGHDLSSGAVKDIKTASGDTKVYAHKTLIDIFSVNDHADIVYTISETSVDFCPQLHVVLLGVKNFMSQFVVSIDYPQQCFSIKKP